MQEVAKMFLAGEAEKKTDKVGLNFCNFDLIPHAAFAPGGTFSCADFRIF